MGDRLIFPNAAIKTTDGRARILHTIKAPVMGADGTPRYLLSISEDITERKEIEEALHQRELQLAQANELAGMASWELDLSTQIATYNQQFYAILGITLEDVGSYEMSVADYLNYIHPEDAQAVADEITYAVQQADPDYIGRADYRILRPDKSQRFVEVEYRITFDEQGQPEKAFGYLLDITERKLTEETIRQNQTLMRTIIDSTPDWIFVKDLDHRYLMVNQGYADSFHMTPEEFIGKNDLDIGFPEEIVKGDPEKGIRGFWADDREIMERGEMKVIDVEPAVVDGEERFLNTIKAPLKDAAGNVTGVVGFVHDITNRIRSEEVVQERETLLRTITDSTPDWIFVKDLDHRYLMVNQEYADSFHMTPEEFIGKK